MIRPSSPLTMLLSRHTRRREFITLFGGAAAAWPLAGRAQERVRRVGVLSNPGADDAEMQIRTATFVQGLQELKVELPVVKCLNRTVFQDLF